MTEFTPEQIDASGAIVYESRTETTPNELGLKLMSFARTIVEAECRDEIARLQTDLATERAKVQQLEENSPFRVFDPTLDVTKFYETSVEQGALFDEELKDA